jgi:hypothetical protein
MSQPIQISVGGRTVGKIRFDESDAALRRSGARRTAAGFWVVIPASLTLDWQTAVPWQPFVSNLRLEVYPDDNSGLELGTAWDANIYSPANPRLEDKDLDLQLRGSLEALQLFEKSRNGGSPKLWIRCFGEVCPVFYPDEHRDRLPILRGVPERVYIGDTHVVYPQDTWATLMNGVGLVGNVLVEVPTRKDFPDAWKPVYAALDEGKRHLTRGGEDGWKGCVAAVRLALEKWQDLEKEDQGPGWQAPKQPDREARTKVQRVDAIRWHLLQLAHLSPHSHADEWTRDDALLAFATLAALLAKRDP